MKYPQQHDVHILV